MSRSRARLAGLLLAQLCSVVTVSSSVAENRCISGGKPRPDEGGIGGTGQHPTAPEDDDSGIGGTGISASEDTGIIGTITGFASICVGGIEVHYDKSSAVEIDGESASVKDLATGQVVEVIASGSGDEVTAKQIGVRHVVTGPITKVDATNRVVEVVGQKVTLDSSDTAKYDVGTVVQVSGLRRSDGVITSSLITESKSEVVWLTGPIARSEAGVVAIGETTVATNSDVGVVGDHVRVAGKWDGSRIVASSVQAQPRVPFDGRVGRVQIEGFPTSLDGNRVQLGAYVFNGSLPTGTTAASDARVRVHALIRDRQAVIEHIAPAGERPPRPEQPGGARPHGGGNPGGVPQLKVDPAGRAMEGQGRPQPPPQPMEARPPIEAPGGERPERPERPDRPDRPDMTKPERPPRVERPEPMERPVVPDRPPRPDRPDVPRRP